MCINSGGVRLYNNNNNNLILYNEMYNVQTLQQAALLVADTPCPHMKIDFGFSGDT